MIFWPIIFPCINRNSYCHEEGNCQNIIDLGFNIKPKKKKKMLNHPKYIIKETLTRPNVYNQRKR